MCVVGHGNGVASTQRRVRRRRFSLIGALAVSVALSGCARVRLDEPPTPEDFSRVIPAEWVYGGATGERPVTRQLLDLIESPLLTDLVEEALKANPDLAAAARRLSAARLLLNETRALSWPAVGARVTGERDNRGFNEEGEWVAETRYRVGFDVSWELDLWGRLSDEHSSQVAVFGSRAADFALARDLLGARVIQGWVTAVASKRLESVARERIEVNAQLERTIVSRYRRGLGSLDDLSAARSRKEFANSELEAQRSIGSQATRSLEVLLGRTVRASLEIADTFPTISIPARGIPGTTLERRPDVAAALWRLESADAAAGAAVKALLPRFTVSGGVSKSRASLSGIFGVQSIWSIVGSLTQPIFQRGRLIDRARAQRLEVEAVWEDCRGVILRALAEVEDALDRERSLSLRAGFLAAALQSAVQSSLVLTDRYQRGLSTIQELLYAREQESSIRAQVISVQAEALINRIDLAVALGVGVQEGTS